MEKIIKKGIVALIIFVYIIIFVFIFRVNAKYQKYFNITEYNMGDTYEIEGASVTINKIEVVDLQELLERFPESAAGVQGEGEIKNVLVYATIDVYDQEAYDNEWSVFWTIEADSSWSNGMNPLLYGAVNADAIADGKLDDIFEIRRSGKNDFVYVYTIRGEYLSEKRYGNPQQWKYKLQVNKTPVVYFKLY